MDSRVAVLGLLGIAAYAWSKAAQAANYTADFQPVWSPSAPDSAIDYSPVVGDSGLITYYDPWGGNVTPQPVVIDTTTGETAQLPPADSIDALPSGDGGFRQVGYSMNGFTPAGIPAQYAETIKGAEDANGIPRNLLAALLWKESRFNPAAHNAGSGANGIAQIVPKWHPTVDTSDPIASINYAAQYLASLYRMFGTWQYALAAYNWGPGNLKKFGIAKAPAETRDYYGTILASVGMTGNVA